MPITLEIVSPTKLVLSRSVDMVVMPGYEGDLAAMEKHAPAIVLLRGGAVSLFQGGTVTDSFYVGGGFAEITTDRCTILADDATPIEELTAATAQSLLSQAELGWAEVDKLDIDARDTALDKLQAAQAAVRLAS